MEALVHGTAIGRCNGRPFIAEMEIDPRAWTGKWMVTDPEGRFPDDVERTAIEAGVALYALKIGHTVPSPN